MASTRKVSFWKRKRAGPPDLSSLPVTIKRFRPQQWPWMLPAVPMVILVAHFYAKRVTEQSLVQADMYIILGLVAATCIGVLAIPILRALLAPDSEIITIQPDIVSVKRRGVFGIGQWNERISNYERVGWMKAETGKKIPQFAHMINLIHSDSEKYVVLYSSYNAGEIRDLWSRAAELLGLPKTLVEDTTWHQISLYLEADGHEVIGPYFSPEIRS